MKKCPKCGSTELVKANDDLICNKCKFCWTESETLYHILGKYITNPKDIMDACIEINDLKSQEREGF